MASVWPPGVKREGGGGEGVEPLPSLGVWTFWVDLPDCCSELRLLVHFRQPVITRLRPRLLPAIQDNLKRLSRERNEALMDVVRNSVNVSNPGFAKCFLRPRTGKNFTFLFNNICYLDVIEGLSGSKRSLQPPWKKRQLFKTGTFFSL